MSVFCHMGFNPARAGTWAFRLILLVAPLSCGSTGGAPTASSTGASQCAGECPPCANGQSVADCTTCSCGSTGGAPTASSTGASECSGECTPCANGQFVADCTTCRCELVDDPARNQYEALSACDGEYICPGAYGVADGIGGPGIGGGECIAGALRDRTPGFYGVVLDQSGGAFLVTQYVLMSDGTDQVLLLSEQTGSEAIDGMGLQLVRRYSVQTCTLKSYEELDACAAGGKVCFGPSSWVDDCQVVTDPSCPEL